MTDSSTSTSEIRVVVTAVATELRQVMRQSVGDVHDLKAAIKDVPNQIRIGVDLSDVEARSKLSRLNLELQTLQARVKRQSELGISTRKSVSELREVERAIDAVTRAEARAALTSRFMGADTRGADRGSVVGRLKSLLSGGGQGGDSQLAAMFQAAGGAGGTAGGGAATGGGLAAAGAPLGAAAGIAIGAGPILGAGALGAAGVGATVLGGLLPLMTLVRPALGDIKKVSEAYTNLKMAQEQYGKNQPAIAAAQNKYNAAVKAFGPSSRAAITAHGHLVLAQNAVNNSAPQVVAAQMKLNKLMLESSPQALVLAKSMSVLDSTMNDAGLKIVPALATVLTPLVNTFKDFLPTLVTMAKIDLGGIAAGLTPLLDKIKGAEFKGLMVQLSKNFAELMPMVFKGLGDILLSFMHTAVAAGPAMIQLSKAFVGILDQVAKFTASKEFKPMVDEMVKSFLAWMNAVAPLIPSLAQVLIWLVPVSTWFANAFKAVVVDDQISKAFNWTLKALGDTVKWLGGVLGTFGDVWHAVWDAIKSAFSSTLDFLLGGFSSLLGAIKDALKAADSTDFAGIFGSKFSKAAKSVGGAQEAIDGFRKTLRPTADTATTQADRIATAHEKSTVRVKAAWDSAIKATSIGLGKIDADLSKELKKIGVNVNATAGKAVAGIAGGFAGGGWIGKPGEKGRDEIPIVVGRGEAVLNHGQQKVVNRALAKDGWTGGLNDVFHRVGGLHYMATGGFAGGGRVVGASMFGGPGDPGARNHPTASGQALTDSLVGFAELSKNPAALDFSALGHLPMGTRLPINYAGKTVSAPKIDVGAGGGDVQGHHRDIDLSYALARLLGFAGLGLVGIGGATAGGQIGVPKWTGPGGLLGKIGQGILNKAAAAANTKLGSLSSTSTASVGAPGGVKGLGTFDGLQVAQWIVPELQYARAHGWKGHITSGYRPGFDPHTASGFSEHQGTQYPHGAIDFGGFIDPAGEINKQSFMKATAGYMGHKVFSLIDSFDQGHMSGTGHAKGGFAGMLQGFATGGFASRAPHHVSHGSKHTHPRSPAGRTPVVLKDALKSILSASELGPDKAAHAYARQATVLDQQFSNLLAAQGMEPVDDPELVTLTDADVKALDPDGRLGYQAGDELVNRDGMVVGRTFGHAGQIQAGTFHRGANTRLAQLAAVLLNRTTRLGALTGEEGAEGQAAGVDSAAIKRRKARKVRIEKYLDKSVQHAQVFKAELNALQGNNLHQALKQALSKQGIAKRTGALRAHLRHVQNELRLENQYQATLGIGADPSHANDLGQEAANIQESLAAETQLGRSGSKAVEKAKAAIYRHELTSRLSALSKTNTGTEQVIGGLTNEMGVLGSDRESRINTLADFKETIIVPAKLEIASFVNEQLKIGALTGRQAGPTTGAAGGPDLAAQLALQKQLTDQAKQAFALSQAQFRVFSGFAPLLTGRMLGSFATGIDHVPMDGLAFLHRGEAILPDPDGPHANRAAAAIRPAAQGPVQIDLHFDGDSGALVKLVDARMNAKALQIVSEHSGQRARLLSGVRR